MLKTAQFVNANNNETLGVAYFIFNDNLCVFTALDDAIRGSSINNPEEIIHAICGQEHTDPFCMRFFDLQTSTSYNCSVREPGQANFEFDEVLIEATSGHRNGLHAKSWRRTICPSQVIKKFAAFIDGTPRQELPHPTTANFYESSI